MNKLIISLLFLGFSLPICLNGQIQLEKVIFQSFSVEDSTYQFAIKLDEPHEILTWNGANVMVETTIKTKNAPMQLLVLVIKDGRYNVSAEHHYPVTTIKSHPRLILKNTATGQTIEEIITRRVYIPEEFHVRSVSNIARREDIKADNRNR
jgi:hypothetical protein